VNFLTKGFEHLELSTQILIAEAIRRKLKVSVMDAADNFIKLEKNGKFEYVKQATRTSADTYIAALIMENKSVTKKILSDNGLNVPQGRGYHDKEDAVSDYDLYARKNIVIKPNSTNFGTGVNILQSPYDRTGYDVAVKSAFGFDETILIEDFIDGKEYRFLVIDGTVAGILHRVPANVTGDGVRNIISLVEEKNSDPLRGTGYVTPLEKIKLGEHESEYLKKNGMSVNDIPEKGKTVYLRENSNISTGGDSIDFTDLIGDGYKDIAIRAVKSVGAKICGVDMIIRDTDKAPESCNHAIIELNFNPALHIHAFPYKGINRKPEKFVLDLLGFYMT
jgi:glutamate--cysteine ligase